MRRLPRTRAPHHDCDQGNLAHLCGTALLPLPPSLTHPHPPSPPGAGARPHGGPPCPPSPDRGLPPRPARPRRALPLRPRPPAHQRGPRRRVGARGAAGRGGPASSVPGRRDTVGGWGDVVRVGGGEGGAMARRLLVGGSSAPPRHRVHLRSPLPLRMSRGRSAPWSSLAWFGLLRTHHPTPCPAPSRWEDIVDVMTEEAREEEGGGVSEEEVDMFELEGGRLVGGGASAWHAASPEVACAFLVWAPVVNASPTPSHPAPAQA